MMMNVTNGILGDQVPRSCHFPITF